VVFGGQEFSECIERLELHLFRQLLGAPCVANVAFGALAIAVSKQNPG
jgi:hypothetical protein